MSITLNLLVLRCADIEASRQFYGRMGLGFIREKHGAGPEHFSTDVGGAILELYPASANFPPECCRLGFSLPAIDALAESFGELVVERDGVALFVVKDPDGRAVEVTENLP